MNDIGNWLNVLAMEIRKWMRSHSGFRAVVESGLSTQSTRRSYGRPTRSKKHRQIVLKRGKRAEGDPDDELRGAISLRELLSVDRVVAASTRLGHFVSFLPQAGTRHLKHLLCCKRIVYHVIADIGTLAI